MPQPKKVVPKPPAWMKHGLCINIVEGQSPTLLATGISRSAIHDLAIDLLVATRKGDREEMVESITLAFQSGVDAEVRRREQQEELRAMEECGVGLSPQTDG